MEWCVRPLMYFNGKENMQAPQHQAFLLPRFWRCFLHWNCVLLFVYACSKLTICHKKLNRSSFWIGWNALNVDTWKNSIHRNNILFSCIGFISFIFVYEILLSFNTVYGIYLLLFSCMGFFFFYFRVCDFFFLVSTWVQFFPFKMILISAFIGK